MIRQHKDYLAKRRLCKKVKKGEKCKKRKKFNRKEGNKRGKIPNKTETNGNLKNKKVLLRENVRDVPPMSYLSVAFPARAVWLGCTLFWYWPVGVRQLVPPLTSPTKGPGTRDQGPVSRVTPYGLTNTLKIQPPFLRTSYAVGEGGA